jgi:hypothetical protein
MRRASSAPGTARSRRTASRSSRRRRSATGRSPPMPVNYPRRPGRSPAARSLRRPRLSRTGRSGPRGVLKAEGKSVCRRERQGRAGPRSWAVCDGPIQEQSEVAARARPRTPATERAIDACPDARHKAPAGWSRRSPLLRRADPTSSRGCDSAARHAMCRDAIDRVFARCSAARRRRVPIDEAIATASRASPPASSRRRRGT